MTAIDADAMIVALGNHPVEVVGADPERLVALVDEALGSSTSASERDTSVEDIVGDGQLSAYLAAQAQANSTLGKLVGAAAALDHLMPTGDARGRDASKKPWTANIDMRASLLDRRLVIPTGVDPSTYCREVHNAISLLAGLKLTRGSYNLSPERAAARTTVRASYFYRYEQGLPLAVGWVAGAPGKNGDGRSARPQPRPKTATAILAFAMVQARGINVDAATVKEILRAYHAEVRGRGTPPVIEDFMTGPWPM